MFLLSKPKNERPYLWLTTITAGNAIINTTVHETKETKNKHYELIMAGGIVRL